MVEPNDPPDPRAFLAAAATLALLGTVLYAGLRAAGVLTPKFAKSRVRSLRGYAALAAAGVVASWWWLFVGVTAAMSGVTADEPIAASVAGSVAGVGGAAVAIWTGTRVGGLAWGLQKPSGLLGGLGWAGIALPFAWSALALNAALQSWLGRDVGGTHQLVEAMFEAGGGLALAAFASQAVVAAPLFEEIVFRGILQTAAVGGLTWLAGDRRWGAAGGVVFVSVAFAVVHPPWSWPAIFVLSLFLGWTYERTGNLWVPIGLHAAFNGVTTGVVIVQVLSA